MNFFELANAEIDCASKDIAYNFSLLDLNIFNESGDDVGANDSIINRILTKITEIVETLKTKVSEFFAAKSTKDTIDSVNAAAEKDPSIKQKKSK